MLERFAGSDGLGAIYPPIVWSIVALRCLGYPDDSPEVQYCREQLDDAGDRTSDGTVRLQPCKSPVWDTAIALRALAAGGLAARASGRAAGRRVAAGAAKSAAAATGRRRSRAEPGGWCFEYANDFYPDGDDTAMVADGAGQRRSRRRPTADPAAPTCNWSITRRPPSPGEARRRIAALDQLAAASRPRRCDWLLAMQNRDGGWGAFDRNNDREFLCHVPFADHNAMIDPSTPDLTGRVLEALGQLGRRVGDPAVDRAVAYVRRTQEADGSWFGRWGVNYIYGTWQALVGLAAVGVPTDDPAIVARRQLAAGPSAALRRLGRIARQLRRAAPARPGPDHRLANRLGPDGAAGRRPCTQHPAVARGVRLPAATRSATTAPGTSRSSPAPASRGCSICAITTTRSTSRCWPWRNGSRPCDRSRRSTRCAGRLPKTTDRAAPARL